MDEASKTNIIRGGDFAERFLKGRVLDIGAGKDPVCAWAEIFDQQHGDANEIDHYYQPNSFDAVHSSHCLEHMLNPTNALTRWWSLVRPGGYMIIIVPDEDLYEQRIWPSFFSNDHKSTFRLDKKSSWSPVSYEVRALCEALPNAAIISAEIHDANYDYSLQFPAGLRPKRIKQPLKLLLSIAKRIPFIGAKVRMNILRGLVIWGYPFDQTLGDALAQIQVIVHKQQG
jgi:SAM-dependent methyltransferase